MARATRAVFLLCRWPAVLQLLRVVDGYDAVHLVDVGKLNCQAGAKQPVQVRLEAPASLPLPHVLTFYRTSLARTSLRFSLYSPSTGRYVVPTTTVELQPHTAAGRRLEESELGDSESCEDFFLLDGRHPVDLPETWEEAREAFRGMCQMEGGLPTQCREAEDTAFHGEPRGSETPFAASMGLCRRLWEQAFVLSGEELGMAVVAALPRRLKGGAYYDRFGGQVQGFQNRFRPGFGTIGLAAAMLGLAYVLGYTTTDYGFTGRVPKPTTTDLSMSGIWKILVELSPEDYSRTTTHCYDGSSQLELCRDGHMSCTPGVPCEWRPTNELLVRDDLMTFGFNPGDYTFPLVLEVSDVAGQDFGPDRSCPPPGWNRGATLLVPPPADLFVALTQAETVEWEERGDNNPLSFMFVLLVVSCISVVYFIPMIVQCCQQGEASQPYMQEMPYNQEGQPFMQQQLPPGYYNQQQPSFYPGPMQQQPLY